MKHRRTYALFGAAPDTSNQGVSALFWSVLEGLGRARPESALIVFDNARGIRGELGPLNSGPDYEFTRVGARPGWRYYLPENLGTMTAFSRLGRRPAKLHPYIRLLDQCDAVLDISGGDSFSDIYGKKRFLAVARPKLIAKYRGIPLVLLPQTYGPFASRRVRRIATEGVLEARMAWARDRRSFLALQELVGGGFDAEIHREGVDMAFTLSTVDPGAKLGDEIRSWLDESERHPLVGVNVSGLIALDRGRARRFGLKANYLDALLDAVRSLMTQNDVRLLLVPHVMASAGTYESDAEACLKLRKRLSKELQSRVAIAPTLLEAQEVKWLISKLEWFCGTRMHSTIAALSSCVPTAAVAYSDKTLGVFESCGVGDHVVDPRKLDTAAVSARLLELFGCRVQTKELLLSTIPDVRVRAEEQFQCIARMLSALP